MSHISVNEICNDIKFYDNMREYNDEFGSKANFFSLKLGLMSNLSMKFGSANFPIIIQSPPSLPLTLTLDRGISSNRILKPKPSFPAQDGINTRRNFGT